MDIACVFEEDKMSGGASYYRCRIEGLPIPNDTELKFLGEHKGEKTNHDVTQILFKDCSMDKIPKGLTVTFPNLKVLRIYNSKLREVNRKDLKEYKNLEKFLCEDNNINFLSGDLFSDFKKLEWLSFYKNNLKIVEPNILDGHDQLKLAFFHGNPELTYVYSIYPVHNAKDTLDDVRNQLYEKFFASDPKAVRNYLNKLLYSTKNGLLCDLKSHIDDEKSKDFKVIIDDQEFHVHKLLLTIRSPTLAEILRNNPDAENLNLIDIPVGVFSKILIYLYTDELPDDDETNFLHLFVAAHRLQIKELKKYAAGKILDQINEENALDILSMSNKYDQNELRQKSFEEIKKKYPKIEFKEEWVANPEKVAEIIEGYKIMEEGIQKLQNQFKYLMTKN